MHLTYCFCSIHAHLEAGGGGCGFLKSSAKRESVASLTKKKNRRVPIDDVKKDFIDHA